MKVALDAGHGARPGHSHTGAVGNGLVEDEIALDLVLRIGHHLRAAGCETVYTRPDSRFVPLAARGRIAKTAGAEMFLSIHCNAGPEGACGAEAFVVEGDQRSRAIAQPLVDSIAAHGFRNREVKWDFQGHHTRLQVLRDTYRRMPAVLLEVGFLTNVHDARLLKDRFLREAVAKEVADQLL